MQVDDVKRSRSPPRRDREMKNVLRRVQGITHPKASRHGAAQSTRAGTRSLLAMLARFRVGQPTFLPVGQELCESAVRVVR